MGLLARRATAINDDKTRKVAKLNAKIETYMRNFS